MHRATGMRDAQALPARTPRAGRVVPAAFHGASASVMVELCAHSSVPMVHAGAMHA